MAVERWNGTKWRARWRDPEGRTQSKVFDKKALAEKHLVAMEHSKHSGTYVDPAAGKITFEDYAKDWRSRQVWRASTDESNGYCLDRAYRVIGHRPMAQVRHSELQALVKALTDEGLAPSTVEGTYRAVATVFRAAIIDRVVPHSPCTQVRLPKVDRPKVHPLEPAQVFALADAMPDRLRALVLFGAGSGLRISETLGVTVDRVDFLRRTLRVDRQLVAVDADRLPVFGPPKTKASMRVVPLGQATVDVLAAHLASFEAGPAGVVFTNGRGEPWKRNRFNDVWATARTRAGVAATPHDLRHHFASVLISAGCSIKAVQEALGHANASETLDTYSHLWPADEDRIRDAVDEALRRNEAEGRAAL